MNFYAYIYRNPSREMEPFYVGKGKGRRSHSHLVRKDHHPMTYRLAAMKKNGVDPIIEIVQAIDEDHAFFLESCLIEVIGRRNLKTGTLLNLTDGGEGPSGWVPSPEAKAKMSTAKRGNGAGKGNGLKQGARSHEACLRMSIAQRKRRLMENQQ